MHSLVKAKANLKLQSRGQDLKRMKSSGQELFLGRGQAVKVPIWVVKDLDPGWKRIN